MNAASRAAPLAPTVWYATGPCSLGTFLVARNPEGVCAILLGDDAEALGRDLAGRFAVAEPAADMAPDIAAVQALVERPGAGTALPLALEGTPFQRQVWQALREIPAGQTRSYGEIAERIGHPGAARAVAQACGANPLAVAVPCHRVVSGDGTLGGYRWGVARKRALLAREGAA